MEFNVDEIATLLGYKELDILNLRRQLAAANVVIAEQQARLAKLEPSNVEPLKTVK